MPDQSTVAKEALIERYLRFIESYGPLNDARIGILGGDGLELRVQKRMGVIENNSWVVESHPGRSLKLLRLWKRHRHSPMDVRVFPQALESFYGPQPYFDAFHWDFYETVETNFPAVIPLVPCLARSPRGGVIAITVSDSRANRTLEHPEVIEAMAKQLLGDQTHAEFFQWLIDEKAGIPRSEMPARFRQADPVKGAIKEMSVFVHLLGAIAQPYFKHHPAMPDRMERYVMISRTTGSPCRMRTYILHLAHEQQSVGMEQPEIVQTFMKVWQNSPLSHINGLGGVSVVPNPSASARRGEETVKQTKSLSFHEQFPKISGIASVAGGEMQQELDRIMRLVSESQGAREEIQRLQAGMATLLGSKVEQDVMRTPKTVTKPASTKHATQRETEAPVNGTSRHVKNGTSGDDDIVRVMGQVRMLEAYQKGEKEFGFARLTLQRELRITRKRNRDRTTGALFARTHGKFLPSFCKKLHKDLGTDECRKVFAKILPALVKLDGPTVTLERLMKEAGVTL